MNPPKREIRELTSGEVDAYTDIAYNAYPSFKDLSPAGVAAYKSNLLDVMEKDPDVTVFGLFENGALVAVMRVFLFRMNYCGSMITASGLGFLGVHLLHKKKGVARDLIAHYEKFSMEKGALIGLLLPFRPDYYKSFGYGFGSKWHQYRFATEQVPAFPDDGKLAYLASSQYELMYDCHARVVEKTHGMLMKVGDERKALSGNERARVVASFDAAGRVDGYLVFEFANGRAGNYTINHMLVNELEFENIPALQRILGFINRQQDQAQLVVIGTGEEYFHYMFENPLDDSGNYAAYGNLQTNAQFIGVMYKVFAGNRFLRENRQNWNGASMTARFRIMDRKGRLTVMGEEFSLICGGGAAHVSVDIDRADFSSLVMGCVTPGGLYKMGRLTLDKPEHLAVLDQAFYCPQKPICNTDF